METVPRRLAIALAALIGAAAAGFLLLPNARLTAVTGLLCPPALVIYPIYLELELRYPGLRHAGIAWWLTGVLVVLLNASLYAALLHGWYLWRRKPRGGD